MAFFSITVPSGISHGEAELALDLGPALAWGEAPLDEMTRDAGFEQVVVRDKTAEFGRACALVLSERAVREAELRAAEGDERFDEDVTKKEKLLRGVREGLLRRVLVTGRGGEE